VRQKTKVFLDTEMRSEIGRAMKSARKPSRDRLCRARLLPRRYQSRGGGSHVAGNLRRHQPKKMGATRRAMPSLLPLNILFCPSAGWAHKM